MDCILQLLFYVLQSIIRIITLTPQNYTMTLNLFMTNVIVRLTMLFLKYIHGVNKNI